MATITKTLGVVTLPHYTKIEELDRSTIAVDRALDATLNVDRMGAKRAWRLSWEDLDIAVWNEIKVAIEAQFTSGELPAFSISGSAYDVSANVYIVKPDINPRAGGQFIENVSIILEEE